MRIIAIKALEDGILEAVFETGEVFRYDLKAYCRNLPVFQPLFDNDELYRGVHIAGQGYGIVWNDDIDLDSNEIYINGKKVADSALPESSNRTSETNAGKPDESDTRVLSAFYGITIKMNRDGSSSLPCFEAYYEDAREIIAISDGNVLEGCLPRRAHDLVIEWWDECRSELLKTWEGELSGEIAPLD